MENIQAKDAEYIISFFNVMTGKRFKFNNVPIVTRGLEAADSVAELKDYIRMSVNNGQNELTEVFRSFIEKKEADRAQVEKLKELQAQQEAAKKNQEFSLDFLGNIVTKILAETKMEEIKGEVAKQLHEEAMEFIKREYGPIQRKVELHLGEKKVELEGVVHKQFDNVLKFVNANEPVFLTGPAGSGKNFLCQQVAKALELDFYFSNAVTQEYKITGFTDANGVYQESQFYKAFKYGGLFMLDEMDASIPEVLIILNAAIANRYFDFPAPIGYVEAHPDFRVVAAGNTFGHGADYDYVGRNQLDAASLDRFAMVKIDYDPKIEESCANGDDSLLEFCRKFRQATSKAGIRTVVSYRAISRMAKLSKCMSSEEIVKTCLVKSLGKDDLNTLGNNVSGCGLWSAALQHIVQEARV